MLSLPKSAAVAAGVTAVAFLALHLERTPNLSTDPSTAVPRTNGVDIDSTLGQLRIPFVPNRGQMDERVAYYGPAPRGTLFVTRGGELTYRLRAERGSEVLTERFVAGQPNPQGIDAGATRVSIFKGPDPNKHAAGLETYNALSLGEVWPGVGVELRARGDSVEKLFTVEPGASADAISMGFDGIDSLRVGAAGELIAASARGEYAFSAPIAYQHAADGASEVERIGVRYVVDGRRYGFALDDYDRSRPIVIDPTLTYATFLGGATNDDTPRAAAVDAAGALYVVGETASTDFPVTPGAPDDTHLPGDCFDVFIAKINPTGTALDYATFLGGADCDLGVAIAVDASGAAYIAGAAGTGLPTTAGAAQSIYGGSADAFVAKLNPAGSAFEYLTYVGGNQAELDNDLDVGFTIDADGHAYLYGTTESPNFPTTAGAPQPTRSDPDPNASDADAFLTKLSPDGTQFLFSTYHGGTGRDYSGGDVSTGAAAPSMVVGEAGLVYVIGTTESSDLPVTAGAHQSLFGGGLRDAFMAIFDTVGNARTYSTYLGGTAIELGSSIARHGASGIVIAGETESGNFPVTAGALDSSFAGGSDLFVGRFETASASFSQLTYWGGGSDEYEPLIRAKADGRIVVGGSTESMNFPLTAGALDSTLGGQADGFVTQFAATLQSVDWSTLIGGSDYDGIYLMDVDTAGNIYALGNTLDGSLPVTAGGLPFGGGSDFDDYFVKIDAAGTQLLDATYLGGSESDGSYFMVVDPVSEVAYIGGETESTNFPATPGAFDTSYGGDGDVYLARFTTTPASSSPPTPQPGTVQLSAATYNGNENGGSVTLTLTRTNGADGAIGVSVASGGGSAASGADYTALTQTVSWADGDAAAKTVNLALIDDVADEPDETVVVALANATGGATIGAQSSATVTIVDDDATPAPQPQPEPQPPTTEQTRASGSYGGGSMEGLFLVGLIVLVCMRRSRVLAIVCTAALAPSLQAADVADGWYLGVRGGRADSTLDANRLSRELRARGHDVAVRVDDEKAIATAFLGYRDTSGFGIEASVIDLGEYDIQLTGSTQDSAALLADARSVLADAGVGIGSALTWTWAATDWLAVTPRVGAYYWESERTLTTGAVRIERNEYGLDWTGGIDVGFRLSSSWAVGVGWTAYDAGDRHDLHAYSAFVQYRFGKGPDL